MIKNSDLGKEIFLLVDTTQSRTTMDMFDSAAAVLTRFANKIALNLRDITLYHGVLTKATSIPGDNISSNIDIVLIIPSTGSGCHIISCFSLDYAQKVVTALVGKRPLVSDVAFDSITGDIKGIPKQTIENIYILYGYEVELHFTFDGTELDEEIIEGTKEIYAEIASTQ
jgi:hypothetical protein